VEIKGKDVGKNVGASRSSVGDVACGIGRIAGFVCSLARAVLLVVAMAAAIGTVQARQTGLGDPIAWSKLPREAQRTEQLILAGGPFPFAKDGEVFGNRERHLAPRPRGYYHEYTVPSPGAPDRGARRIVCGGERLTEPEACFYTEDHYNTFHPIVK
jgi:ribonuclease T1